MRVNELLEGKAYTQAQVAGLFGLAQPHDSELVNYRLNRFSSERLMYFMTLLDRDVQIVIKPKAMRHKTGSVSVLVTA